MPKVRLIIILAILLILAGSLLTYAIIPRSQSQLKYTPPTFIVDYGLSPARDFNSTLGTTVHGVFDLNVTEPAPIALYVQEWTCSHLDCSTSISSNSLPVNITMTQYGVAFVSLLGLNFTDSRLVAVKVGLVNCNYSIFLPQSLNATEYSIDIFAGSHYPNGTFISGANYPLGINTVK